MKTFETEKHKTPEGATHYSNEEDGCYFCWYIVTGESAEICALDGARFGNKWQKCTNEHKGVNVKPIPQQEVEWKNGDECIFTNRDNVKIKCKIVGLLPPRVESYVLHCPENQPALFVANVARIEKPESPEEKEKREAVDAICWDVKSIKLSQAVALYEAGYRK